MDSFLSQFAIQFSRSLPLFLLMGLGYALSRWFGFNKTASASLSRFALFVALTAMLFRTMAGIFGGDSVFDFRVIFVFFSACFVVFLFGRYVLSRLIGTDPVGSTIAATGCVFSNNGLLGFPLAMVMLGESCMPSIAAIVSVNAMILWTLASIFVELARQTGSFSWKNTARAMVNVFKNPLIIAIFSGVLYGLTGLKIPAVIDAPLKMLAQSATPLCLIVVGMGLAEYGLGKDFLRGLAVSLVKLSMMPVLVLLISQLIGLGPVETTAIVFLASLPVGVNVYLMAKEFNAAHGTIANSLLISTVLSSVSTPVVVTCLRILYPC